MLLAVEMERVDDEGNRRVVVDMIPCEKCIIRRRSRAFLVCLSSEDANRFVCFIENFHLVNDRLLNRVKYYCSICYPVLDNLTENELKNMRRCSHGE